jgi:type IV secretory pathway TrbF-like protein
MENAMADGGSGPAKTGEEYAGYLAGRREWDARYGDLLVRAKNWRLIAFALAGAVILSIAGLIFLASRGTIVPYVVTVDDIGRVLGAGIPDRTTLDNDRLKKAALWDWIIGFRSVATDGVQQSQFIKRVYARLAAGSPAEIQVSDFYRADPPQQRAQTMTVAVDVKNILPTSANNYEIEWIETTRDLHGAVQGTERYRGSFTVAINPPKEEREALINPIGLYVTQLRVSKVL